MRGVSLTWAGGHHRFVLDIDQLRALQQYCDAGPNWVLHRLTNGQWLVDDVVQPIRLGLEGGGLAAEEAEKLVRLHVKTPLAPFVLPARVIVAAAVYGGDDDTDDAPGEQTAPKADGAGSQEGK